jgi:ADP-heptose:LPS heptosyltransferase
MLSEKLGPRVLNMCGKLTLGQSASLVKQATVVVTHDTGLMHIAAAFQKPIVSIWGNTIPEFGMYPYMPSAESKQFIAEVKELSCRPCSKIGYSTCPKKHFRCMQNQDFDKIVEEVRRMFG